MRKRFLLSIIIIVIGGVGVAQCDGNTSGGLATTAGGRDVVVINDLNVFDNTAALDSNNVHLYRNLVNFTGALAAMNRILVHVGHGYPCPTNNTCIGGVSPPIFETVMRLGNTYTVVEGTDASHPLTAIADDIKVVILWLPVTAYTAQEVTALKQLLARGGRIVVVGEQDGSGPGGGTEYYTPHRTTLNTLLTNLGSTMQNASGAHDCTTPNAHVSLPPASVKPHQVTANMIGLSMACASGLTLGPNDTAIFRSVNQLQILGAVSPVSGN